MKPPQEVDADDPDVLDGNAAAGLLQQIFASEILPPRTSCARDARTPIPLLH
jgi:hypothetical protein